MKKLLIIALVIGAMTLAGFGCNKMTDEAKNIQNQGGIISTGEISNENNGISVESLYACLSQDDTVPVLPEDLQNSTDTVKKADYIVNHNLYVIACNKLWHGDENLSGTSTISDADVVEGFRLAENDRLYIVYSVHEIYLDELWSKVQGYLEIDTKNDAFTAKTTDMFTKYCSSFDEHSRSPDGKYCLSGYKNEIAVYAWLSGEKIITTPLKVGENADACCNHDECIAQYDIQWTDNRTAVVTVAEQDNCKETRKITIKI